MLDNAINNILNFIDSFPRAAEDGSV